MLDRISSSELTEWMAYYLCQAQDRAAAGIRPGETGQ
jgi:hypothetical protein